MRWFQSKHRKNGRDSDWDFFDGYPPNLRMRRLKNGVWEERQATEEEMQEFVASETAFLSRSSSTSLDDAALKPDDRPPGDAESNAPASDAENQTPQKKT